MMEITNTQITYLSWILQHLSNDRKKGLISDLAANFGISRQKASNTVKQLTAEGWIDVSGNPRRPEYAAGENRLIFCRYIREEIDEGIIWLNDFRPYFPLPKNVDDIAHYGFTEILNNAHDHSNGNNVQVVVAKYHGKLSIMIDDDGVGIFKKIQESLNLPDPRLSLLELSKGKLTTDSQNHSGQGIFFSSKMFDFFDIESSGLRFHHNAKLEILLPTPFTSGTSVMMSISLDSDRRIQDVFDEYASPDEDYSFNKTIVPVRLASIGGENLVSRSQAKRLVARFDGFKTVLLDFKDIDTIGQAFSDEVFRVFCNAHPDVSIIPVNTSVNVKKMIHWVKR